MTKRWTSSSQVTMKGKVYSSLARPLCSQTSTSATLLLLEKAAPPGRKRSSYDGMYKTMHFSHVLSEMDTNHGIIITGATNASREVVAIQLFPSIAPVCVYVH